MRIVWILALLVALTACSGPATTESTQERTEVSPPGATPPLVPAERGKLLEGRRCYLGGLKQDTIRMQVEIRDGVASGTLAYEPAEKDRNRGTFTGRLYGDTLLADYTFQSEGVTSIRPVAFLLRGDSVLEGYGQTATVSGKEVFADARSLSFGTGYVARQVPCAK